MEAVVAVGVAEILEEEAGAALILRQLVELKFALPAQRCPQAERCKCSTA